MVVRGGERVRECVFPGVVNDGGVLELKGGTISARRENTREASIGLPEERINLSQFIPGFLHSCRPPPRSTVCTTNTTTTTTTTAISTQTSVTHPHSPLPTLPPPHPVPFVLSTVSSTTSLTSPCSSITSTTTTPNVPSTTTTSLLSSHPLSPPVHPLP
ncbi:hypothetical protein E2C01_075578 [Portunus trituberculatus]|uniref:Uncharacterized protein n=1 Tax=Portunus trituberculatus TaxID=210409 RepID=A0A5B7IJH6_PORTR|nr:hypothetical protein [Portunus trituberculatus]